ncbi:MAG: hypothetical protein J6P34_03355 [Paludibacteraceae bacterium]|nr:hypothetical protein [Paludibacteraceae bacterium]MBO7367989.1 hypothetical protein [Paludibacteraceae bacterium]
MKKLLLILIAAVAMITSGYGAEQEAANAADTVKTLTKAEKKALRKQKVKEEWKAHFNFYGFARSYLTYDTRQGFAPISGLYYFVPKDVNLNEYGQDLNATPEFRYLSITSRLGLDVKDYRYKNTHFGAKIEADFAFSANGTFAVALRLRHAYFTMTWKDLPIAGKKTAQVQMLFGQTWHPISRGNCETLSFDTGSPFDVSNRSPQITMDATFDNRFTLTASLVAQMQYVSTGPEGASAVYQRNGLTPEALLAFTYTDNGFTARAGVDVLSIRPRIIGKDSKGVDVPVKDRITTITPYLFLEYKYKDFLINAKTAYAEAGEHINVLSGYAVTEKLDDGTWKYTSFHTSTTWAFIQYGSKYMGSVFGGYSKNLGTYEPIHPDRTVFINGQCSPGINQYWRIIPSFKVRLGKFMVGVEYHYTAAQYGDATTRNLKNGIVEDNLHWVGNHRILALFQYSW